MKQKLNGKDVDALMLNCVEVYGVASGLLRAIGVGEDDDLPESGEAYVCQVAEQGVEESYAQFVETFSGADGEDIPALEELKKSDWLVLYKIRYHLDRDDEGDQMAVFDGVEPARPRLMIADVADTLVELDDEDDESVDEMRQHWLDFILPIPPLPKKANDELYLTLAYEFYDAIKAGTKRTEYRDYTPNWVKKILSHPIRTVKFQRGYGGPGHAAPEQMVWTVERVSLCESATGQKGDPLNPPEGILPDCIAIDLGKRLV